MKEAIHGLRAGLAVIAVRPKDVLRVAFSRASARIVEPQTRAIKARGVPCRMYDDHELDKLAHVEQHEGLYVEAQPRAWMEIEDVASLLVKERAVAVALDGVRNPYNVGAILRTAAFLGARAVIIGASPQRPALDAQAVRVAEGGAEHLVLAKTPHLGDALAIVREKGVRVIGADSHAKKAVEMKRPLVLALGHERDGLHERVRAQCDGFTAVPGTGRVESLNVAVAAGILLSTAIKA